MVPHPLRWLAVLVVTSLATLGVSAGLDYVSMTPQEHLFRAARQADAPSSLDSHFSYEERVRVEEVSRSYACPYITTVMSSTDIRLCKVDAALRDNAGGFIPPGWHLSSLITMKGRLVGMIVTKDGEQWP